MENSGDRRVALHNPDIGDRRHKERRNQAVRALVTDQYETLYLPIFKEVSRNSSRHGTPLGAALSVLGAFKNRQEIDVAVIATEDGHYQSKRTIQSFARELIKLNMQLPGEDLPISESDIGAIELAEAQVS